MVKLQKHNIILIGFMGSGKTSVGKQLSGRLGYSFKDTDLLIEKKEGTAITNIFDTRGEEYFRELETELLKELRASLSNTVLSTGGGMPVREQNGELLKEIGYVVYLRASKETIISRLKHDNTRPLLQGGSLEEKVDRLLKTRAEIYERTAHKIIDTDELTLEQIADLVIQLYKKVII